MATTTSQPPLYAPPQGPVPLTDESWRRWFTDVVWGVIGRGVGSSGTQGTFPQLQVGQASFTRENEFQELLNVDQGIYVNYSSTVQNIIYGFACNVRRAGGKAFTVGAQINAYAGVGSTGDVYGLATTSIADPSSGTRNIIGYEPDVGSFCNNNTGVKWGINPVFKDRSDGQLGGATTDPLGSNYFNYQAIGIVFTSQPRSTTGEYCGWTVGMDFLDGWCDQASVPAWNNSTTYLSGAIVSNGGVLWKAIVPNTNVVPAVGTTWVQRTVSGTSNLAVGIDFSSISVTTMALMASAIRLRSSQHIHWEETGAIGTQFDAVTSVHWLTKNSSSTLFGLNVISGTPIFWRAGTATGGATPATLGNLGSGPGGAAQVGWFPMVFNQAAGGATCWVPFWQ